SSVIPVLPTAPSLPYTTLFRSWTRGPDRAVSECDADRQRHIRCQFRQPRGPRPGIRAPCRDTRIGDLDDEPFDSPAHDVRLRPRSEDSALGIARRPVGEAGRGVEARACADAAVTDDGRAHTRPGR